MNRILPYILATITRRNRYKVDIQWSEHSYIYNLFRIYELIFWRREGIRPEMSACVYEDDHGVSKTLYSFHSWEAVCVHLEQTVRSFFKIPKFKFVKIYIPQFAPIGVPFSKTPYLFAIAFDVSDISTESSNLGQSWVHTITGSNPILTVWDIAESSTTDPYSGMTFNSVNMTVANSKASTNRFCKAWYLTAPATGAAHGIVPALSPTQTNQGASISYSGASQGTIDGTAVNSAAATANPSFTITPTVSNCWVASGYVADAGTPSGGTGTTSRRVGSAPMAVGDSNGTVSGSTTMNWTNTSSNWGGVIMSIAPFGTTFTLTCSPASFTFTGQSIGKYRVLNLICAPAVYIFTGISALINLTKFTWRNKSKNSNTFTNSSKSSSTTWTTENKD